MKSRRRWRIATVSAAAIGSGLTSMGASFYFDDDWYERVSTTVLVLSVRESALFTNPALAELDKRMHTAPLWDWQRALAARRIGSLWATGDLGTRFQCAPILVELKDEYEEFVLEIVAAGEQAKDYDSLWIVVEVLSRIDGGGKRAEALLLGIVRDDSLSRDLHLYSSIALGRRGVEIAGPAIFSVVGDRRGNDPLPHYGSAVVALGQLRYEGARGWLTDGLHNETVDPGQRLAMQAALDILDGDVTEPYAAWMDIARQSESPEDKQMALFVLGWLGIDAASTCTEVAQLLKHGDAKVRSEAVTTLGRIGWRARSVLSSIEAACNDPDPEVAAMARRAMESAFGLSPN